jgi:protein-tyrosine phosphatase
METRVLMVCLGNICRSPLAEGAFEALLKQRGLSDKYRVDSAGTGGWHVGEPPHPDSQNIAQRNGVDISHQRSRQVSARELSTWDWLIAMDQSNLSNLIRLGAPPSRTKLLLSFVPAGAVMEVPDPYYEGGFDRVFDLVNTGCRHLLDFLEEDTLKR